MCLKVLAKQELPTTTVEAFVAQFGVVCTNTLSNLETLDILADGSLATNIRDILTHSMSRIDLQLHRQSRVLEES